eukprot:1561384-Prymnesium_polylepis.1
MRHRCCRMGHLKLHWSAPRISHTKWRPYLRQNPHCNYHSVWHPAKGHTPPDGTECTARCQPRICNDRPYKELVHPLHSWYTLAPHHTAATPEPIPADILGNGPRLKSRSQQAPVQEEPREVDQSMSRNVPSEGAES